MSHFPITVAENQNFTTEAKGTVIKVLTVDPDIADVIDAGFDRIVVERSENAGVTWAEITTPSERPVLVRTKVEYSWRDRMGDPSYLYRLRYLNTRTGGMTEPSEGIEGIGLAIRNILTVTDLIDRYFFGIDLTNDSGQPLPDSVWQHYILTAIRWFEHEIDISILPTQFVEKHDFYAHDYDAALLIQLDNYPVTEVSAFRAQYPSGQDIIEYPAEWFRVNGPEGHIQIVPTAGTLSEMLIGQGGSYLPAIYNGSGYLPQLFEITYIAGFEEGKVPRNIIDIIGMIASLGPFNIFGDLITGAGIGNLSLSLDGLSQSITTTQSAMYGGYGSRILAYTKQVKDQMKQLRRHYKRIGGMVVA